VCQSSAFFGGDRQEKQSPDFPILTSWLPAAVALRRKTRCQSFGDMFGLTDLLITLLLAHDTRLA
jgi:hypothetical protein